MKPISRATLKDVAARSGYALRTVKKVMSGDPTVRDKTRTAVLEAAEALSYTPNRAASALGKQKQLTFAVVYTRPSEVYFRDLEAGFHRAAAELFDYGLNLKFFTTGESSWEAQDAILNKLLAQPDLHGVIIQPVSAHKLDNAINKLADHGIPVLTVGSDAPESRRLCFVGCDAIQSGRISGQLLAAFMGGRGRVLIAAGRSDQEQVQKRVAGLAARFAEQHPNITIRYPSPEEQAMSFSEYVPKLVQQQEISAIFSTSGTSTITLGKLLRSIHASEIFLSGFDLSSDAAALMREGWIQILLDQKPQIQAYEAVKLLFSYVTSGIRPEPIHTMPIYPYTSECLSFSG